MEYVYIPNTYNKEKIHDRNFSGQQFLNCQIKYRESLESIIKSVIDFTKIDTFLSQYEIPKLNDNNYNFYHKFTSLGSNYIYLRNNIHIENLDVEDINYINTCIIAGTLLEPKFIEKTLSTVIFEEGNFMIFGLTNIKNQVQSKSIVFEFAFDQIGCRDIQHLLKIEDIYEKYIKPEIISKLSESFKIPVSIIKYNGIPDLFMESAELYNDEEIQII